MKKFLLQFFTWWNGQTLGTRFFTYRKGVRVGEDAEGNIYYRTADDTRRWVIYNGLAEPSRIPPGWHGWIHHRAANPPPEQTYSAKPWETPHQPNLTGTAEAYRPPGSILTRRSRPPVSADYGAWKPKS